MQYVTRGSTIYLEEGEQRAVRVLFVQRRQGDDVVVPSLQQSRSL
jgi:hypothetical protein